MNYHDETHHVGVKRRLRAMENAGQLVFNKLKQYAIPAKNRKGENLLLFIGIIDILQSYRMSKKLEHFWKSLVHDGDTISVHQPHFYAKRFQSFLFDRVFKRMPPPLENR